MTSHAPPRLGKPRTVLACGFNDMPCATTGCTFFTVHLIWHSASSGAANIFDPSVSGAPLSVAPWEILVKLVQIGGIGGTLVFLLLGYYLLWKEQDKKDAQGNPFAPNQVTIDAIYRFLKYALVFFFVGIAAQVVMLFTQDTLRRWNQPAMSQILFDRWFYDPGQSRVIVSFSEIDFADVPVITKSKRGERDVYVGIRSKQATKPTVGEYPVLLGPFNFTSTSNEEKALTADQITRLGACVQFELFGVAKDSGSLAEPFKPAVLSTKPVVFNTASSCN
jgi:hypothetical protein